MTTESLIDEAVAADDATDAVTAIDVNSKEKLGEYSWIAIANPMTSVIEAMKFAFLGQGEFSWLYLGYSFGFMTILLAVGVIVFNKVEQTFMDTV